MQLLNKTSVQIEKKANNKIMRVRITNFAFKTLNIILKSKQQQFIHLLNSIW